MKFNSSTKNLNDIKSDCLILPLFESSKKNLLEGSAIKISDDSCDGLLSRLLKNRDISPKQAKCSLIPVEGMAFSRVLVLGMGKADDLDEAGFSKALAEAIKCLMASAAKNAVFGFSELSIKDRDAGWICRQVIMGLYQASYRFDQFKSKKADKPTLTNVTFHCEKDKQSQYKTAIKLACATAIGQKRTKDLGNLPGNVCTPTYLANEAKKLAKEYANMSVKVLDEKQMASLKMGALLSVSKGSKEPAKLIVIEYKGGKKGDAPHMLVGKGITFDSGGISLKPGPQMDEMKYDMCGAASVIGTMTAIGELGLNKNIVALIASAENMPDGGASKPGDIVTTSSGQTVEILNTDAEGRLVLCDALTYAEKFKPASVVDIATLTGACIIALGSHTSGVMANNDDLASELLEAGKQASDKGWQLPIWDEYQQQLDSNFADMQNIGGRGAGTITAACFLSRFAKKYPWAHLDIAGTAWVSGGKEKGATGRPVPMLVQYLVNK